MLLLAVALEPFRLAIVIQGEFEQAAAKFSVEYFTSELAKS